MVAANSVREGGPMGPTAERFMKGFGGANGGYGICEKLKKAWEREALSNQPLSS